MNKGNSQIYHEHIIQSINFLDKRKDGFIQHRLQFLNKFCAPIRHKIQMILTDIKFYQNMRDTAYQVIESQEDIKNLKKQIQDYKKTNKYYSQKLDQFDKCKAQLQVHIEQSKQKLESKKLSFKQISHQLGDAKSSRKLRKIKQSRYKKIDNSTLFSQKVQSYSQEHEIQVKTLTNNQKSAINQTISQRSHKLPILQTRKQGKYFCFLDNQRNIARHYRNQDRLQKIIRQSEKYKSLSNSIVNNPQQEYLDLKSISSITGIKQIISEFDHTQALFRDCFQRKKLLIQKSVTQLQSKLISSKQLFLNACERIGQRQGNISYQQFCSLSSDELVTLFISFSWLSKKIYNQFTQKRKNLINALKIIKKSNQQ